MMTDDRDDLDHYDEAQAAAFVARTVEDVVRHALAQGVPLDVTASAVLGVGARALLMAGGPIASGAALRRMAEIAEREGRRFDA